MCYLFSLYVSPFLLSSLKYTKEHESREKRYISSPLPCGSVLSSKDGIILTDLGLSCIHQVSGRYSVELLEDPHDSDVQKLAAMIGLRKV